MDAIFLKSASTLIAFQRRGEKSKLSLGGFGKTAIDTQLDKIAVWASTYRLVVSAKRPSHDLLAVCLAFIILIVYSTA